MRIKIFDFDKTIYSGDSSVDFYLFCLKKKPTIIKYVPTQAWHLGMYILGLEEKTKFKSVLFGFIGCFNNIDKVIDGFWKINYRKIKPWYLERDCSNDVIISASPDFLLRPVLERLGAYKLIATQNDKKTGVIKGKNCFGEEKVLRLSNEMKDFIVEETYTDSLSDLPILNLAKSKYMVIKDRIIMLSDYRPSKIKKLFLSKKFIAFLIIGCINALIGVSLSFLFSLFIESGILAFVFGYAVSLIFSYFLNSIFTFKNKNYSFRLFSKFCISYIPNFLIQLVCVYVLIGILLYDKLFSYTLSVVIGLPVTFALLSLFAFKKSSKRNRS